MKLASAVLTGATLMAQLPVTAPLPVGPGAAWVTAEMSFEATLVKGVPFSGEFVTESEQTLADGNRIRNSNTELYARDSEGRTRREVSIAVIGPFQGGAPRKTIFIHDPVAKVDYILDPQEKTARKINLAGMGVPAAGEAKPAQEIVLPDGIDERRTEGPKDVLIMNGGPGPVQMERRPLPEGIVLRHEGGAVVRRMGVIGGMSGGMDAPNGNVKFQNEPLGKRMIDGVEAEGTRSVTTIPVGQIGNERPLETVTERWYSEELKTVVRTTRKDPRMGETVYRLQNVQRGEPSRHLFEVPGDYRVMEGPGAGNVIRMRVKDKH
jgi:hypothetical protein